jgi:hypothetical protein
MDHILDGRGFVRRRRAGRAAVRLGWIGRAWHRVVRGKRNLMKYGTRILRILDTN